MLRLEKRSKQRTTKEVETTVFLLKGVAAVKRFVWMHTAIFAIIAARGGYYKILSKKTIKAIKKIEEEEREIAKKTRLNGSTRRRLWLSQFEMKILCELRRETLGQTQSTGAREAVGSLFMESRRLRIRYCRRLAVFAIIEMASFFGSHFVFSKSFTFFFSR